MYIHKINENVIQNALKEMTVNVPSNFALNSVSTQRVDVSEVKDNIVDKIKIALSNKNCMIVGVLIIIVLGMIIFKKDKKVPAQSIIYL